MARSGESKTSVNMLAAADRQRQALELRRAGAGYDLIARQLGYAGPPGAHKAVATALHRMLAEPAEDVRALELARLDRLQLAHWSRAIGTPETDPDPVATSTVLKIMERRAKLMGLDAPATINVRTVVDEVATAYGLTPAESVALLSDVSGHLATQRGSAKR